MQDFKIGTNARFKRRFPFLIFKFMQKIFNLFQLVSKGVQLNWCTMDNVALKTKGAAKSNSNANWSVMAVRKLDANWLVNEGTPLLF